MALTDTMTSQKKLSSFRFSGTSAAVALEQRITVVNLYFRCRAWQAQILDANCCDVLPEDWSNVYEVIRHENAKLVDMLSASTAVSITLVYCVKWPLSTMFHFKLLLKEGKSDMSHVGTM